jgi:hypothetical protein
MWLRAGNASLNSPNCFSSALPLGLPNVLSASGAGGTGVPSFPLPRPLLLLPSLCVRCNHGSRATQGNRKSKGTTSAQSLRERHSQWAGPSDVSLGPVRTCWRSLQADGGHGQSRQSQQDSPHSGDPSPAFSRGHQLADISGFGTDRVASVSVARDC